MFTVSSAKCSEQKFNASDLFALSVMSQNVHAEAQVRLRLGGSLDATTYESDAVKIKNELKRLSGAGILINKQFLLLSFKEFDDVEGFELLDKIAFEIGKGYGFFTAKEMIDFGIYKYLTLLDKDAPVKLDVFLPDQDMKLGSSEKSVA
jgi:hypothetical protein